MSSLMTKASTFSFASFLSGRKPNCAKKWADSASSFTGRLTAILVDTGASVIVPVALTMLKNSFSAAGELEPVHSPKMRAATCCGWSTWT
jgi:hypothetical protein